MEGILMRKIYPATSEVDSQGNVKWTHKQRATRDEILGLWPVYAPYTIYEKKKGEWVISGDKGKHHKPGDTDNYHKVWSGEVDVDGVQFIKPMAEMSLLSGFLAIDTDSHDDILLFVNRYGLLGVSFGEAPFWVVSQISADSPGVPDESLDDFQLEVAALQRAYGSWKAGDTEKVLRALQANLAGVREYPQAGENGAILPGKIGLNLISSIWLHFYNLVIGPNWRECKHCKALFEYTRKDQEYCPLCRGLSTPRVKRYRQRKVAPL
jgi:hypothetical protein